MPSTTTATGTETGRSRAQRATPLPPSERRAAIIAATLPLMRSQGMSVTTRQIAEAAGVAEGTIFGVFHDKDTLLQAALEAAFDPEPVRARLAEIDLTLPLDRRLVTAVEIMQRYLASIWELMSTPGLRRMVGGSNASRPGMVMDVGSLVALFDGDRHLLRRPPAAAAQLLFSLTLGGSHPAVVGDKRIPAEEIVSVLLDGIRSAPVDAVAPGPSPRRRGRR